MYLSEIKSNEKDTNILANKLKYDNMDGIPATGFAGGIALFWHKNYKIRILSKDKSFIHCTINDDNIDNKWFITFIRGPSYSNEKAKF